MTPAPKLLKLGNCAACGYLLEGLAPVGTCPECGAAYERDVIVLRGFGTGHHSDVSTARPWVAFIAAVVGAGVISSLATDWLGGGRRDLFDLLFAAAVLAYLVWALWKRWTTDMPGLVQVRLGPDGVCQIDNPTPARQAARKPTPWRDITGVSVESTGVHRLRLRLVCEPSIWHWKGIRIPVDADLSCTPEQDAALRHRIAEWRERGENGAAQPATHAAAPRASAAKTPPTCGRADPLP